MNASSASSTYLVEADELLEQIEQTALELAPDRPSNDDVNRLFRAFHTIKGSGAMFGFDAVAEFTHHIETVLDEVRAGRLGVTATLIQLILRAKDHIKSLLTCSGMEGAPATPDGAAIISELHAISNTGGASAPQSDPKLMAHAQGVVAAPLEKGDVPAGLQSYRITFRPGAEIMATGINPISLLNDLRDLGECSIKANAEGIPSLEDLQPDRCYLSWEIGLKTDRGVNAIKDVFIFVEDVSEISITPAANAAPAVEASSDKGADSAQRSSPAAQPGATHPAKAAVDATTVQQGRNKEPGSRTQPSKEATVRVSSERLDRLVNLVGEFVMNQSRLSQLAARTDVASFSAPVEELERLVSELRDNVLGIRMMPIGSTFSRFKRLVHDLSGELGKEIDLVTEGAETELDKTVLDQLGDPLVHLIRNSIDHGIEAPDDRLRAGKSRRGTIRLTASHEGAHVIVAIEDDGRGLDVEAIRAKAIERNLITPETNLSENEIYSLIFLPGFSTARQITNVSGRGVGMDVVKRQIEALRGSIQISSRRGAGTTIALTLPLTLAIIDGLLVAIGADQFILPMSAVTENVELTRLERSRNNGRNLVNVRGELVPYIRLRELFGITGGEVDIEKVVIARTGEGRIGLVVDRVLGSHQTVIQSLGRFYRNIRVLSGATIMGDGRVALILDLVGVVRHAEEALGSAAAGRKL